MRWSALLFVMGCVPSGTALTRPFTLPTVARAGLRSCRAAGAPGVDGFRCSLAGMYVLFGGDGAGEHWPVLRESVDVEGIVNGGGCGAANFSCKPGECLLPRLSGQDDCRRHTDADFEFHLVTRRPALLAEANFWGGREHGPGDLTVEWEWLYFFPLIPSAQWEDKPLVPGMAPWPGDRVVLRGTHVLDCGEANRHGSRAEIHPPIAVAWMHGDTVYVRAASRSTDPHPGRPFGPPFVATFPAPAETLAIGPIVTDHAMRGYRRVNDQECTLFDARHPSAHIEGGEPGLRAEDLFDVSVTRGFESFSVAISPRLPPSGSNPDLVGFHFRVTPGIGGPSASARPIRQ